jgi:hypothetical protein
LRKTTKSFGEKKILEKMDHGMPFADIKPTLILLISWLLFWELVICSHVERVVDNHSWC